MKTASIGTPFRQVSLVASLAMLAGVTGCHRSSDPDALVPVFNTEPAPLAVSLGSSATFTTVAVGPPAPTYQWYRTDDAGSHWTLLPGATGSSYTLAATAINDNNAWFEVVATNLLGFVASTSAPLTVTEVPGQTAQLALAAQAVPMGITAGPDGNIWFTNETPGQIGTLTGVAHTPSVVALPNPACMPTAITAGPDGRMWFTENATGNLGAITLDGTVISEYPAQGKGPAGLATGPNGALWYTLQGSDAIGVMTPAGAVVTYGVPTAGAAPLGIVLGRQDGNLWFTESAAGKLARITPTGAVTEWVIPTPTGGVTPVPQGIVSTSDGALWFADQANAQIVKFTPSALFQSVALPAGSKPTGLAVDASGNLWVAAPGLGQVSQVTPAGTVTSFPVPTGTVGQPTGLAIGSDGNLFITEPGSAGITQLVTAATGSGVAVAVTPATVQVAAGLPLQLFAQVTGSPDTAVIWSIREGAAGGSLSATGLYTAPATAGTYHLIASSLAAPEQTAMATVTVTSVANPVIAVPSYVTANTTANATVPAQAGSAYVWTITGGTITAGKGTNQIAFTAGASGYVQLSCTVTNATVTASATETAVSTIAQAPLITSFTATPPAVAPGGVAQLTAVFSGGGGSINQGLGTVTSAVPVTTPGLSVSTTYTLTVTNAAGTPTTAQVTVGVL